MGKCKIEKERDKLQALMELAELKKQKKVQKRLEAEEYRYIR